MHLCCMIIGFDAKRIFNNQTGLGNYSRLLVSNLYETASEPEFRLFTPKISLHTDYLLHKKGVKRIMPQGTYKHLSGIWRSVKLAAIAKSHGVNVFHGLSNELPAGLSKQGIAGVVTIHDLIFLSKPELYSVTDRLIYQSKVRSACKQANLVLATSEATKNDLVRFLQVPENKIEVHYQDADAAFAQPVSDQAKQKTLLHLGVSEPFVLNVGTLEQRKNHIRLLKAFHSAKLNNYQLVLIGKPADAWPAIKAYIETHNLGHRVKVIHKVSFQELLCLYHAAHAGAYISEVEGFGIPVLEALKAKLPLLTSSVSSMGEIAGEAAYTVNPFVVEEIKEALEQVCENNSVRTKLMMKRTEQLAKFDGMKQAEKLWGFYNAL